MTRGAIIGDTCVIKNIGCEGSVCVANVTILNRWDVARRLNKSCVGNKLASVTASTATGEPRVNIA